MLDKLGGRKAIATAALFVLVILLFVFGGSVLPKDPKLASEILGTVKAIALGGFASYMAANVGEHVAKRPKG